MTTSNRLGVRSLWLVVGLLACARHAAAQTEGSVSVGVDYGMDFSMSDDLDRTGAFGVSFRLPRPHGLSAAWDFGAIAADLQHAVHGADLALGEFTTRPLLGGVAYSARSGRLELTAIVTGGVSFSSLELSDAGKLGVRSPSGAADERVTTSVVPAFQPKLTLWVDLNRWFAVVGNASYLWQRPEVTLTNGAGTVEKFTVNADMLRLSVGLVVRVF